MFEYVENNKIVFSSELKTMIKKMVFLFNAIKKPACEKLDKKYKLNII